MRDDSKCKNEEISGKKGEEDAQQKGPSMEQPSSEGQSTSSASPPEDPATSLPGSASETSESTDGKDEAEAGTSPKKKTWLKKQESSSQRRKQIDEYKQLVLKEERKLRYLKRHGELSDDEFTRSPSSSPKKKRVSFEK